MRLPLLAAIVSSLVACAGTGSKSSATNANGKTQTLASSNGNPAPKGKYSCSYEEAPGSHIREKVCRYEDADRQTRDQSQNELMSHHGGSNMPTVGGR